MTRLASNLLWGVALIVACAVSLGLIVSTILSSDGVKLNGTKQAFEELWKWASQIEAELPAKRADEVRSYTLFTNVDYGDFTVTTGVQYASTTSPDIESQWCYIAAKVDAGQSYANLTLATNKPETGIVIPSFRPSALAQFSLTQSSVQDLIGTHCRFQ